MNRIHYNEQLEATIVLCGSDQRCYLCNFGLAIVILTYALNTRQPRLGTETNHKHKSCGVDCPGDIAYTKMIIA